MVQVKGAHFDLHMYEIDMLNPVNPGLHAGIGGQFMQKEKKSVHQLH